MRNHRTTPPVDNLLCHFVNTAAFGVPVHLEEILVLPLPDAASDDGSHYLTYHFLIICPHSPKTIFLGWWEESQNG